MAGFEPSVHIVATAGEKIEEFGLHPALFDQNITSLILSNLRDSYDLDAATLVCRDWRTAVQGNPHTVYCRVADHLPFIMEKFTCITGLNFERCVYSRIRDSDLALIGATLHMKLREFTGDFRDTVTGLGICELAKCKKLVKLKLSVCDNVSDELFSCLFTSCSLLRDVVLCDLNLFLGGARQPGRSRHAGIPALVENCCALESLTFENCAGLGEEAIDAISTCSSLSSLVLGISGNGLNNAMARLGHGCKSLRHLELNFMASLPHLILAPGYHAALTCVSKCCPQLRSIVLNAVPQEGIGVLATCRSLSSIQLGRGTVPLDAYIRQLAAANPGLTDFTAMWRNLGDSGVIALAQACPRLRKLYVYADELTDFSLECLASCSDLKFLRISSHHISSRGLQAIASSCHQLVQIALPWCRSLHDDSLQAISLGLPRLQSLDLSYCTNISSLGLEAVARCRYLECLNLKGMQRALDGGSLLAIVRGASKLRHLDLSECIQLMDAAALTQCRHLEHLWLDGCPGVSDSDLGAICRGCTRLRTLSLKHTFISDVEKISLCQQLRQLDLTGCLSVVDSHALKLVARKCRWLRTFTFESSLREVHKEGISDLTANGCLCIEGFNERAIMRVD